MRLIKRAKKKGAVINYKSRYKEMRRLLQGLRQAALRESVNTEAIVKVFCDAVQKAFEKGLELGMKIGKKET